MTIPENWRAEIMVEDLKKGEGILRSIRPIEEETISQVT